MPPSAAETAEDRRPAPTTSAMRAAPSSGVTGREGSAFMKPSVSAWSFLSSGTAASSSITPKARSLSKDTSKVRCSAPPSLSGTVTRRPWAALASS